MVLLCLFECIVCVQSDRGLHNETNTTTLYVLAMIPKPNEERPPANDRGYSFIPAVQLAIEHINEAAFLSQGFNIELDMLEGDSGCDVTTRTSISFTENIYYQPEKPVIGAVGPFCSAASIRLAELTYENRSEIVNLMLGNTPILDDHHNLYQYTFGMITSSVAHVNTLIKMIEHNSWTRVAVLYDSTRRYFTSTFRRLIDELKVRNLDVIKYVGPVDESFYIPLNEVDAMDIRIVFVLLGPNPARKVACIAGRTKFLYPAHQFIFMDREADNFIEEGKTNITFSIFESGESKEYVCDIDTITAGVNGSLLLRYALDSVDETVTTVSGYTVGRVNSDYELKTQNFSVKINTTVEPYIYAGRYYDATWALALGLNKTLSQNDHMVLPLDSTFRRSFRDSLYDVNFQGVSVKVIFDKKTGHVTDNVDIFQVSNMSTQMTAIGVWNGTEIVYCTASELAVNSSNCNTPGDGVYLRDTFEEEFVKLNGVLAGFGLLGVTIVFLIALILHVAFLILRNYRIIKASSPRLSHFIFLGCYLQIFAVLLNTIHLVEPFRDGLHGMLTCNLIILASLIGIAFIFSTIIVRSWRLYRIFNHSFNSQKYNSDYLLATIIVILVAITVVLYIPVILWGRVDLDEKSQIKQDEDEIPVKSIQRMCRPRDIAVLFVPVIYQFLLALAAVVLAVLNRKVKLKEFNDTKRINILAFILAILWVLSGAVLMIVINVRNDLYLVFEIYTLLIVISVLVTQCVLFVPLVISIATKRYSKLNKLHTGFRKMSLMF